MADSKAKPNVQKTLQEKRAEIIGYLFPVSIFYMLAFCLFFVPSLWTDGTMFLQTARIASIFLDHDLDLSNDLLIVYDNPILVEDALQTMTRQGYLADFDPIGSSVLSAPFWLAAWLIDHSGSFENSFDRSHLIYRTFVSFAAAFFVFIGLWIALRTAWRLFASRLTIALAILFFFGSQAFFTGLLKPDPKSSSAILASALFFFYLFQYLRKHRLMDITLLGATSGMMLLCEWSALPLLILPIVAVFFPDQPSRSKCVHEEEKASNRDSSNPLEGAPQESIKDAPAEIATGPIPLVDLELPVLETKQTAKIRLHFSYSKFLLHPLLFILLVLLLFSPQIFIWYKIFGGMGKPFDVHIYTSPISILNYISTWWDLVRWHPIYIFAIIGCIVLLIRRIVLGSMILFTIIFVPLMPALINHPSFSASSLLILQIALHNLLSGFLGSSLHMESDLFIH